jgi:uncharacterized membrane protein
MVQRSGVGCCSEADASAVPLLLARRLHPAIGRTSQQDRDREENTDMSTVTKSIDVNVPIRAAYDQWTQFEEFPRFMEGVKEVRQLDDTHLHWKAEIAGVTKEWDAEITEQHPDERVAWKSTSGARNAGVVTFHRLDDDRTRVTLQLDVEPDGPIETVGDWAGVLDRQVEEDLDRFSKYITGRGEPTGAWRGNVESPSSR